MYWENVAHYSQVSIITKYTIVDTLGSKTSIRGELLKKVHYDQSTIRKFTIGRFFLKTAKYGVFISIREMRRNKINKLKLN